MTKTLVTAQKASVGRDLAGALEGPFQRRKLEDVKPSRKKKKEEETNEEVVEAAKSSSRSRAREETYFLESDDYVITWAVGHLVQLAEPEEYDEKWKKWRMADLPIVPPKDRKSTRLNSSHVAISYAVFCLKKKKQKSNHRDQSTS